MNYWDDFYIHNKNSTPSLFAQDIAANIINDIVVDLGCGNGRDSLYLARYAKKVIAIDSSVQALATINLFRDAYNSMPNNAKLNIKTMRYDIVKHLIHIIPILCQASSIYMRFFLHAIPHRQQQRLLDIILPWMRQDAKLFIECRSNNGRVPDHTHNRWLVSKMMLRYYLRKHRLNYSLYEGRGYAKTENEDPLIIRVIGRKSARTYN